MGWSGSTVCAVDMFLVAVPAFRIPAHGNIVLIGRVALRAWRQLPWFTLRRFAPVPHVVVHGDGVPMNTRRTGPPEGEWSSNRSFRGKARSSGIPGNPDARRGAKGRTAAAFRRLLAPQKNRAGTVCRKPRSGVEIEGPAIRLVAGDAWSAISRSLMTGTFPALTTEWRRRSAALPPARAFASRASAIRSAPACARADRVRDAGFHGGP